MLLHNADQMTAAQVIWEGMQNFSASAPDIEWGRKPSCWATRWACGHFFTRVWYLIKHKRIVTSQPPRVKLPWKRATDSNYKRLFDLYQLQLPQRSLVVVLLKPEQHSSVSEIWPWKPGGPLWLIRLRNHPLPLYVRNGAILAAERKAFHLIQRLQVQPEKARRRKENTTKTEVGSFYFSSNSLLSHIFISQVFIKVITHSTKGKKTSLKEKWLPEKTCPNHLSHKVDYNMY